LPVFTLPSEAASPCLLGQILEKLLHRQRSASSVSSQLPSFLLKLAFEYQGKLMAQKACSEPSSWLEKSSESIL
jgi:hypothetical protein